MTPTLAELLKEKNPDLYEQFKGRRLVISKKTGQNARNKEIKRMCQMYSEQGRKQSQVLNKISEHFPELSQCRVLQIWKGI